MLPVRVFVQHREKSVLGEMLSIEHQIIQLKKKTNNPINPVETEDRMITLATVAWEDKEKSISSVPIEALTVMGKQTLFDMAELLDAASNLIDDDDDDDDDDGDDGDDGEEAEEVDEVEKSA